MAKNTVTRAERSLINSLVKHYAANQRRFQDVLDQLKIVINGSEDLQSYIHSVKSRVKDPDHLRDKVIRKLAQSKTKHRAVHDHPRKSFLQNW